MPIPAGTAKYKPLILSDFWLFRPFFSPSPGQEIDTGDAGSWCATDGEVRQGLRPSRKPYSSMCAAYRFGLAVQRFAIISLGLVGKKRSITLMAPQSTNGTAMKMTTRIAISRLVILFIFPPASNRYSAQP
jgi:hypothetical protein